MRPERGEYLALATRYARELGPAAQDLRAGRSRLPLIHPKDRWIREVLMERDGWSHQDYKVYARGTNQPTLCTVYAWHPEAPCRPEILLLGREAVSEYSPALSPEESSARGGAGTGRAAAAETLAGAE